MGSEYKKMDIDAAKAARRLGQNQAPYRRATGAVYAAPFSMSQPARFAALNME